MKADAEKYKEEDEKQKDRIEARNSLESYAFYLKSTIVGEDHKDKVSADDIEVVFGKCDEVISWLDSIHLAEKEELDDKRKEMEAVCEPIIAELYQMEGRAGGMSSCDLFTGRT